MRCIYRYVVYCVAGLHATLHGGSNSGSPHATHDALTMLCCVQEVKILAAVEGHPNIVTYHDSWAEPSIGGDYQYIKCVRHGYGGIRCGEAAWSGVEQEA